MGPPTAPGARPLHSAAPVHKELQSGWQETLLTETELENK